MAHEHVVDECRVHLLLVRHEIDHAVGTLQVERDPDVAELKIEVDDADRPLRSAGQSDGKVGGDGRTADPTLWAVDRDDRATLLTTGDDVAALQSSQVRLVLVCVPQRRYDLASAERSEDEAAGAGTDRARNNRGRHISAGDHDAYVGRSRYNGADR